jgi:hypothetical protein
MEPSPAAVKKHLLARKFKSPSRTSSELYGMIFHAGLLTNLNPSGKAEYL